jgi:serine phosphatase RsbU (regulator of sigma subunit)
MITQQQIDKTNLSLWYHRYINPIKNFNEAEVLLENSLNIDYLKGIHYARLNMAKACFLQSKNQKAFELIAQILDYFKQNPLEAGYIWLLNLKASLYESLGDYEKGLTLGLKAIKMAKERKDRETEADSASILGLIYTRLCNFGKAIEHYQIALKIRENTEDHAGVASTLNRLGMISRLMGDYESSINYYRKSLDIRKEQNLVSAVPWTMLGIASTYEDIGKYDEALSFYQKGSENSDKRCSLQCAIGSGRIYSKTGETKKAEEILTNSLELADELQAHALKAEIYLALSNHYELNNQPAKALETYKKYQQVKEDLSNEETQNRLRNVEISHAIEKSEQEKEIFRLRNVELKSAYDTIEEKNREITDSIKYASYIQEAILPHPEEIKWLDTNMFILFLPKDIVSGDFYWFTENDGKTIIVAADCTGHGVPGALMSMLGVSLLEEIVNRRNILNANEILDNLRQGVIRSLKQLATESKSKDGMDISLIVIDKKTSCVQFAGANNSLCKVSKGELTEYKADKMPIGIHEKAGIPFTGHFIPISSGDMIYIFSDGFQDQFGGADGKKFMAKRMKELFVEIASLPLPSQKEILFNKHIEWKGNNHQVDDVLVVGVKVKGERLKGKG